MTENHDTPDSGLPTAENDEPHRAGNAGQPTASFPSSEKQCEGQTNEWPDDGDCWDDDELDDDQDRFESPNGWDDDEPHRDEPPVEEVDSLWPFGEL